jgi:large subunit ribosomal protein L5
MNRLQKHYNENVVPALTKKFGYKSPMQVPRLLKVVLNSGVGEVTTNSKAIDFAVYTMTQISGQKPLVTRSKKAISNFKLRENLAIGCLVTMRRLRMYEFCDRLIAVALPRVRDFRGIPKRGFDGRGNYTLGIKESIVFPEVNMDKLDKIRGMDVTFVTSAKTDEEGMELLKLLGMPFRNDAAKQQAGAEEGEQVAA